MYLLPTAVCMQKCLYLMPVKEITARTFHQEPFLNVFFSLIIWYIYGCRMFHFCIHDIIKQKVEMNSRVQIKFVPLCLRYKLQKEASYSSFLSFFYITYID